MTEEGVKTVRGNGEWSGSVIAKILKNEKYCGDLLQKKTVTPDYLTHRKVNNWGQEEKIYLRDHHEPIIARELWESAQEELERRCRRKAMAEVTAMTEGAENISGGRKAAGAGNRYPLSGKIRCGCCGSCFVARQRISRKGNKYLVWRCAKAVRERIDISAGTGCAIGYQLRNDVIRELVKSAMERGEQKNLRGESVRTEDERGNPLRAEERILLERRKALLEQKRIRMLDSYFAGEITVAEMEKMKTEYVRQERELDRRMRQRGATDPEQEMWSSVEQILAYPGKRLEIKLRQQPVCSVSLPNYREHTAEQREVRDITYENTVIGVVQGR